jgi:hypothetical protein
MIDTDNYVLLTHSEEYCDPCDCDEDDDPDESWYTYELIVPIALTENCELALEYCGISHEWTHEYNGCHHYRLAETDADDDEWQKVTDKLSMAMAEFDIEYGHDLICYHD